MMTPIQGLQEGSGGKMASRVVHGCMATPARSPTLHR